MEKLKKIIQKSFSFPPQMSLEKMLQKIISKKSLEKKYSILLTEIKAMFPKVAHRSNGNKFQLVPNLFS